MTEVEVFCAHDEMVDPEILIPHPDNPNTHPQRQVTTIGKLISEVGWRLPITVSRLSGFVVRGHGRLLAALDLGFKTVPVNYQDYNSPTEEIVDLVADNTVPEFSKMAEKDLARLMKKVEVDGADLSLLGLSEKKISKMFELLLENRPNAPDVPFSMELFESSNYVVLVFSNDVDWLQAQTIFELQTVKALDSKPGFEKKGIGRVLDGPRAIKLARGK